MLNLQEPGAINKIDENELLNLFNRTDWSYDTDATLVSLYRQALQKYPQHAAAHFGRQRISYEELESRSEQLKDLLMENNIGPGSYVPILFDRSIDWLVSVLAAVKTGAAYVPIDPAYPGKRIQDIINDINATVILISADLLDRVEQLAVKYIDPSSLSYATSYKSIYPEAVVTADTVAYTIFTSGSTGKPKGVKVKHRSIQHLITWHNDYFMVRPDSRLSLVAGLGFDICVWETWSALCSGATLYIANNEERTNAAALITFFNTYHITHGFVPTVLAPALVSLSRSYRDLQLKYLFTAGEKLKPILTENLNYELIDYYGPTECTVYATFRKVKDSEGAYISSIGGPIANTRAYILNEEKKLVPIGAAGELYIGGVAVADGYLNNPTLTAEKFIPNPFRQGERLYCTGDLAQWNADGSLVFLGRKDKQVKIRGYRIELAEIEGAIALQPAVKENIVIARDNKNGNQYLIAFIVCESHIQVDLHAIRQRLKQLLPGYMIPSQLIQVGQIPVTTNGKTDLNRLYELADQEAADSLLLEPPTNPTEKLIATIWSEELERPIINVTDNFFDIGGDSFLVAVVILAIGERLNTKVYIRDIYQHPVLQDLSNMLIARTKEQEVPVEDVEPYVELQNDVYLKPETVFTQPFDSRQLTDPQAILLTGITGFVGIHLIQDLLSSTSASIYCLIRAQNPFQAIEKIKACFNEYKIPYTDKQFERIIPVIGDLTHESLGISTMRYDELADKIDIIYHSASSVNFIEPYSYMKQPNVEGLREIVHFASLKKTKCLVLLSTISVYSWGHIFTGKTVMKEDDDIAQNLLSVSKDIGYVRSKWVMEAIADLAREQGLPLITYRLGYAMCHSRSGASAPYQWWSGLVKNCFDYNSYPALDELREGLITVDYMTRAISHISTNPEAIGKKFNLIARPETNLTLIEFFNLLNTYYNFDLKPLSYKNWRKQWEDDNRNRLYPLTSLFKDNMHDGLSTVELYQNTYIWDCSNVIQFLEGTDIHEPVFDKELLGNYLSYLGIPVE
ncbi:amino acid adenylation domain-containing protein [Sphingobacterium athyrii]|uniref:Thioester reductase n=1 Tax=Sphingobacterium athyrii TaxID=2152717 RepID=A0A363NWH4_9SPHI|nr:amino acid adenylation domain-containing protein [Sphingobacterium athyrii]PUV25011.1 thioester reductase [Sphingobacterium athyrii]